MTANNVKYRLGIDLGTNSLGWAAVKLNADGEPYDILDMGVRIFPDGRDAQGETSNAAGRRLAREQRRRRSRYVERRGELMTLLIEFDLMPEGDAERKASESMDPYELRKRSLDEPLEPFQLGRALFHLNQRRGFKSNRKAGSDETEESKMREDIAGLRTAIRDAGARTLGEYLAWRHSDGETVRARRGQNLYPDRTMYESEFDAIRNAQAAYHTLSGEHWDELRETIFFQRKLKAVDPGLCRFEAGEKRVAHALPVFQESRILQEVNNLRLRVGTRPERPLLDDERDRILKRLKSGGDLDLKKPLKGLRLPDGAEFNLARGVRVKVKGDESAAILAASAKRATKNRPARPELFGKKWFDFSLNERNEIVRFLLDTDDPELVRERAIADWGFDESQAEAISYIPMVSGYGNLSEKAIRKMLPHLKRGLVFSEAAEAAGYNHSDFRSSKAHDSLPYYGKVLERDVVGGDHKKDPERYGEPTHYGSIPNPTVHIGLNQLRHVVNQLIKVYGKPEEIIVELARELKMNREQKWEYEQRQRKGRDDNVRFTEILNSLEIEVTADALRKLRLWEEQGPPQARLCPYTGAQLSCGMVISAQTEVDHILPFRRTLDNSPANMVVCLATANRVKGDRSPFEAFGHSPPGYDYDAILVRAKNLPPNKRWRFQKDAMERFDEEDRFLDRQLNETRYLSRTARTYLEHLYAQGAGQKQRVYVVPGHMTALLRRGWGLEGLLRDTDDDEPTRKQRDDHRHHAVDAFVVANTTRGLLQRFARASAAFGGDLVERLASRVPKPWADFHRNQLKRHLDAVTVSYKPDHGTRGIAGKTSGKLHNETAYRLVDVESDGGLVTTIPVTRKHLLDITNRNQLSYVRDEPLRIALTNLWDRVQAEGGKPADFAEQAATEGVQIGGHRQLVRRVRVNGHRPEKLIPIKDERGRIYKGYKPDSNEFADVWQMRDGSWKIVAVPRFYANQPDFDIERFRPEHRGRPDPIAKRLMRLHIDDMGVLGVGSDKRIVRIRQITDGRVVLDGQRDAVGNSSRGIRANSLRDQGFRKIHVDEIGKVKDQVPFSP